MIKKIIGYSILGILSIGLFVYSASVFGIIMMLKSFGFAVCAVTLIAIAIYLIKD